MTENKCQTHFYAINTVFVIIKLIGTLLIPLKTGLERQLFQLIFRHLESYQKIKRFCTKFETMCK